MDVIGWSLDHPWQFLGAFTVASLAVGGLLWWLYWPLGLGWFTSVPIQVFRLGRQNIKFALRDAYNRGRYGTDR